jgi:hypothetical protein
MRVVVFGMRDVAIFRERARTVFLNPSCAPSITHRCPSSTARSISHCLTVCLKNVPLACPRWDDKDSLRCHREEMMAGKHREWITYPTRKDGPSRAATASCSAADDSGE